MSSVFLLVYALRERGLENKGLKTRYFGHDLGSEADKRPAANGFVTMDISSEMINVEYYARDMTYEGQDLYPVACDLQPSYSFQIKQKSS